MARTVKGRFIGMELAPAGLCRAASCLREAKIVKGERRANGGNLLPPGYAEPNPVFAKQR